MGMRMAVGMSMVVLVSVGMLVLMLVVMSANSRGTFARQSTSTVFTH